MVRIVAISRVRSVTLAVNVVNTTTNASAPPKASSTVPKTLNSSSSPLSRSTSPAFTWTLAASGMS